MTGISRLVAVMTAKEDALQLLRTLLEEEQKYIVELKSEELAGMNSRKEEAAEKIRVLNESFRGALANSFQEAGLAPRDGLSPLIEKLADPERETVRSLQNRLISVSRKIEELLAVNGSLLESSLRVINCSMAFFRRVLSKSDTYGNAGRMLEAPMTRLVHREI